MLSVVSKGPEIVAVYPRQDELEETITRLVRQQLGVKEDPDLWLMTMAEMAIGPDRPAPSIVAGTVQRMIRRGQLVGVDYSIGGYHNTFVLPSKTVPMLRLPIHVVKSSTDDDDEKKII